ncbi:LysO family transporter [uncultured Odoribacter sp.]|uniref:LysO family transporter n=1 Tax=uncultured Odoribacter sp. TaxID=876416 RepID=UPI0026113BC4|nr:LysO family transporter [uncultured Odoribacter sp.]
MLIVIGLMVSGIILGYLFRERNLKFVQKLITWAIFILLFLLGISVGVNDQIMDHLDTIGMDALLITFGAVTGSILCAWGIYKFYFSK